MNELTEEWKIEIREAFQKFDADGSGGIDVKELKIAMRALGFVVSRDEISKMVIRVTGSKASSINFMQFQDIVGQKILERDPMNEINKAFDLFDKDHNGKISLYDLKASVNELGESFTDDELRELMHGANIGKNNEIDKEQFVVLMKESGLYGNFE